MFFPYLLLSKLISLFTFDFFNLYHWMGFYTIHKYVFICNNKQLLLKFLISTISMTNCIPIYLQRRHCSWYCQNLERGWRNQPTPNPDGSVKKSRACHERKQVVVQAVSKPSYVEELSQIVQVLSEHGSFWAATAANSQQQLLQQNSSLTKKISSNRNVQLIISMISQDFQYPKYWQKKWDGVRNKAQVYFLVKSQRFKKSSWILQIHPRYVQIQKQFS